jgi:hypothetical protein
LLLGARFVLADNTQKDTTTRPLKAEAGDLGKGTLRGDDRCDKVALIGGRHGGLAHFDSGSYWLRA